MVIILKTAQSLRTPLALITADGERTHYENNLWPSEPCNVMSINPVSRLNTKLMVFKV